MRSAFGWDIVLGSILVSAAIVGSSVLATRQRPTAEPAGRYQLGPGFKTSNADGTTNDYWVVLDTAKREVTYVRGYLATEAAR